MLAQLVLLALVSYVSVIVADAQWHWDAPKTAGGRLLVHLDNWQASYRASRARAKA